MPPEPAGRMPALRQQNPRSFCQKMWWANGLAGRIVVWLEMNVLEIRVMKAQASPQNDQVLLDANVHEVRWTTTETGTGVVGTVIEEVNSFQTELADRASRQTRLLMDMLNRDARRRATARCE